ncbi:hypothetical protein [Leptolyngbya sp. Heron Island J]|uniref:hypothetical protein n=1 Tax=Leptolyngbya sp. Heron Island J TaxID=1385935 RepID=UPI0003FE5FBB|nr:hypothetical protein [Leptolyngbya sp. Heron Island J]
MPSPTTPFSTNRNQLLGMFLALLILDATLILLTVDLWAIGRILFTAVIMFFTLQGYKWAKWLLVGILALSAVALVGLLLALGSELSAIVAAGSVVMAVFCCVIIGYLAGNSNLKKHFAWKRQQKT